MFERLLNWVWPVYQFLVQPAPTIAPALEMTPDDLDQVVHECQHIAPSIIQKREKEQLRRFLCSAYIQGVLSKEDILFGVEDLVDVFRHFPIDRHDPERTKKCLLQCVIAFMLGTKGHLGNDDCFDNRSFHLLYLNRYLRNGVPASYCTTLTEFNQKERAIFFKIKGCAAQIEEKTDWEDSPNKPEIKY